MFFAARCWLLVLCLAGALSAAVRAQPQLTATLPRDLHRREALKLYAYGLLCERDSRYLEAVRSFEEALRLDPDAAAVRRALIPLYLALERTEDALAATGLVLVADPGDYESWYLRARLFREKGQPKDSCEALTRAVACQRLKEQPALHYQMATQLAVLREENKDIDGAIATYREVLQILERPQALLEHGSLSRAEIEARSAYVGERIGTLCLQNRRYEDALAAFARAQAKHRDGAARLHYHLAKVYVAQDKPAEALGHLNQYLGLQPPGAEAYVLKIDLLERLNRGADVLPELRKHSEADAHNVALQVLVAEQCVKARQWPEAERRYGRLVAESPTADVYRGLFNLYKVQGPARVREILVLLDQSLAEATAKDRQQASSVNRARAMLTVLRDDPELLKVLLPLAVREIGGRDKHLQTTWEYLAILATSVRQLDYAEQFYRQCLTRLNPEMEPQIYGGLLQVLFKRHKYEEMVQVCQKGLKEAQQTNRYLFYQYVALALCRLGRYAEAIAQADRMVELATNDHRLRAQLVHASLLSDAEQHERAIGECLNLLKEATQPGQVRDIRYALATVYSAAKQIHNSEEQLRLILQAEPDDATANNDLGYHLADEGRNLDEAEKLIRRAIDLDRQQRRSASRPPSAHDDHDRAAYVDSLGWVLFRQGRFEDARRELETATTLPEGDDAVIWDHLGDVYLRLKDIARAKTAWEKAEQLYRLERRRQRDQSLHDLQRKLKLLKQETRR